MKVLIIPLLFLVFLAPSQGEEVIGSGKCPVIDPSSAFPSDTLIYLDISNPVEKLDMLTSMAFWPEIPALLSETPGPFSFISHDLAAWGETSELRKFLGDRIAIGWTPVPTLDGPATVFVLQGGDDQVASLVMMVNCVEKASILRSTSEKFADYFWITDKRGRSLLVGREVDGWLIFSTPKGIDVMESVAATLASESPPPYLVLSESENFTDAMSGLPSTGVRGYINTTRLCERIAGCPVLSPMARRMAKSSLAWTSGIGIAREIHADGIRTWVSGRMIKEEVEAMVPGLMESMYSIGTPLSARLPGGALCTYEVGIEPRHMAAMMDHFLETASPWFHEKLNEHHGEFTMATGLDPVTDLFPYLQRGLAVAWLPSDDNGWPFPRAVILTRTTNGQSVKRFLDEFLRWKTGAMAPFTQGLLGATGTKEIHEGVELTGIELDCIFNLPMPSPTFAVVDDVLVFSPIQSAVKEAVSVLHGNAPALSDMIEKAHIDAVELIHLNPKAWEREWNNINSRGMPFFDRACGFILDMDPGRVKRIMHAFFRILGTFEPATGSTVIDEEGRFTFHMEIRLR